MRSAHRVTPPRQMRLAAAREAEAWISGLPYGLRHRRLSPVGRRAGRACRRANYLILRARAASAGAASSSRGAAPPPTHMTEPNPRQAAGWHSSPSLSSSSSPRFSIAGCRTTIRRGSLRPDRQAGAGVRTSPARWEQAGPALRRATSSGASHARQCLGVLVRPCRVEHPLLMELTARPISGSSASTTRTSRTMPAASLATARPALRRGRRGRQRQGGDRLGRLWRAGDVSRRRERHHPLQMDRAADRGGGQKVAQAGHRGSEAARSQRRRRNRPRSAHLAPIPSIVHSSARTASASPKGRRWRAGTTARTACRPHLRPAGQLQDFLPAAVMRTELVRPSSLVRRRCR